MGKIPSAQPLHRVLVYSHSAVTPHHQDKYRQIARQFPVSIRLLLPEFGREEGILHYSKTEKIAENFQIIQIPSVLTQKIYWTIPLKIAEHLADFQPDLVYIDEEPQTLSAWVIQKLTRKWRASTPIIFYSWENLQLPWTHRFPRGLIYEVRRRLNLAHATAVICGNQAASQIIRTYSQLPAPVIPQYGVTDDWFDIPLQFNTGKPIRLGFVGRLLPEKGIATLLQSLCGLTFPYFLDIVGTGPYEQPIRDQIRTLGVSAAMRGHIPHAQLPEIMQEWDCLIIPSQPVSNWQEQFGRVITEALALGKMVIGSDSGAIPEIVGDSGLIFPWHDVRALQNCLNHYYQHRASYQQSASERRADTKKKFSGTAIAQATGHIWLQAVNRSGLFSSG